MNSVGIQLSASAIAEVKRQLEKRGTPDSYLRLGIKGGGCSGFSYVLQFEDNIPKDRDITYNFDGVKIIVDHKSMLYLNGCLLDYEKTLIKQGFKFVNPNEANSCGCGNSFSFK